jgi:hypothetical protein
MEKENLTTVINGKEFIKSSFSSSGGWCVGVSVSESKVCVVNTNEGKTIVEFTRSEWEAFIQGVKNNEFDLP